MTRPMPCHAPHGQSLTPLLPPNAAPAQVGSEVEVFRALAAWTERSPGARQPRLAARLARCVRLPSLALPDLYALGDHPLVSAACRCRALGGTVPLA